MNQAVALTLLITAAGLAGCVGTPPDGTTASADDPVVQTDPTTHVVVAGIDAGINPYNEAFRDESPQASIHPATYIDGYPADAVAIELSFDTADLHAAMVADCAQWDLMEAGQLVWFPGTRIIGAIAFSVSDQPCGADNLPTLWSGGSHGTMTASRTVGQTQGLCPQCKFVAVKGLSTDNMLWAAHQPWIDLQTNSWGTLVSDYVLASASRDDAAEAAATHPTFVSAGNGLSGFFGVTGHPIWYDGNTGPQGILAVGAHDNGRLTTWGATMPHILGDGMGNPSADHNGFGRLETGGSGTSSAAPFAAGAMARFLWELRNAVGDTGNGPREGALVVAPEDWPRPTTGPLDDGVLSLEEAKRVYLHTADPRLPEDATFDGAMCGPDYPNPICALYPTTPVRFDAVPDDVPMYYYTGYGLVGDATWPRALDVALGNTPEPDRALDDRFARLDADARRAFDENQPL